MGETVSTAGPQQSRSPAYSGTQQSRRAPAYIGNPEFKEALHVPSLAPPDFSVNASVLFPLVDVSGSMHTKLETAKTQICSQFVTSTDANAVGMMAFTTQPYLIVPLSSIASAQEKEEFKKAVSSLFIPAHSGTDIPAALFAYLKELNRFLDRVPPRSEFQTWKTSCVVITDGLNEVEEATWGKVSAAVADTRTRAKGKNCYLFIYLLNLHVDDVDENVLQRMSQVLRAERAVRAGLQPLQVYDTISQHMVTLEKCVSRISDVKQMLHNLARDSEDSPDSQDSTKPFPGKTQVPTMKMVEANIKIAKVELKKHHQETKSFDSDLKAFEEETRAIFQVERSMLADDYRSNVEDRATHLQAQIDEFEGRMKEVRSTVRSSKASMQDMVVEAFKTQYSQDLDHISTDLESYEEFLQKNEVASEDLKEELAETYKLLQERSQRFAAFLDTNKSEQFDAEKLLARTQKQRERAHSLAKATKIEARLGMLGAKCSNEEEMPEESKDERITQDCGICFKAMSGVEVSLQCGHLSFCNACLAAHIKAKADQNLPAYCPVDGCGHELFQDEVDSICCSATNVSFSIDALQTPHGELLIPMDLFK